MTSQRISYFLVSQSVGGKLWKRIVQGIQLSFQRFSFEYSKSKIFFFSLLELQESFVSHHNQSLIYYYINFVDSFPNLIILCLYPMYVAPYDFICLLYNFYFLDTAFCNDNILKILIRRKRSWNLVYIYTILPERRKVIWIKCHVRAM